MDTNEEPVVVPAAVLAGIDAVRETGSVNMFDRRQVAAIAARLGHAATFIWIGNNQDEYCRGVSRGFTVEEEEER